MNETKKTILIVEDDTKSAKALSIRLSNAGYTVLIATDGIAGASLAEQEPPDLIIADIFMPIGSGFAMAYRLRQSAAKVPIIFISGRKNTSLRRSAKQFGATAYLEKPYDTQRLLKIVAKALSPKATTRRLAAAAPAAPAVIHKKQKRILIVEDDRKIALGLSIRLQAAGYEVDLAHDALVGAKAAEVFRPHLLLLDITMPGGGGFRVAERIRESLPESTRIIFLTANKHPRLRARASELGAAGFFEKPYDARMLLSAIHDALEGNPGGDGDVYEQ